MTKPMYVVLISQGRYSSEETSPYAYCTSDLHMGHDNINKWGQHD